MNEKYSYISYTFFKNLQEMIEKLPWCLFEIYHMYGNEACHVPCWILDPKGVIYLFYVDWLMTGY